MSFSIYVSFRNADQKEERIDGFFECGSESEAHPRIMCSWKWNFMGSVSLLDFKFHAIYLFFICFAFLF